MRTRTCLILCPLLFAGLPATADIIYDNGGPSAIGGLTSDYDDNNLFDTAVLTADDFVLATGGTRVTGVHWWGKYDDIVTEVDAFTILFYEAAGGNPDSVIASYDAGAVNRTVYGEVPDWGTLYEYDYVLPTSLDLSSGTMYFLSIVNNTPNEGRWLWLASHLGDSSQQILPDGEWDSDAFWDVAFYLTGPVVPEPASMTLLGFGIAALAVRIRRAAIPRCARRPEVLRSRSHRRTPHFNG